MSNLGNLETVGGDFDLQKTRIADLGKLKTVGGDLIFAMPTLSLPSARHLKKFGGIFNNDNPVVPFNGQLFETRVMPVEYIPQPVVAPPRQ
ncbi:MAG: hypothetical protein ACRC10_08505 [Thermoguttaceae bacterium]